MPVDHQPISHLTHPWRLSGNQKQVIAHLWEPRLPPSQLPNEADTVRIGSYLSSNQMPGGQPQRHGHLSGKVRGLSWQQSTRSQIKPDKPKMAGAVTGNPWPDWGENVGNRVSHPK